jgi:hypothetical protein
MACAMFDRRIGLAAMAERYQLAQYTIVGWPADSVARRSLNARAGY